MPIQLISLDKLRISPLNVRKSYDKAAMEELKASIMAHGIIKPSR
jgi:ParB-like chromosome segregation protein Spo0J